LPAAATLLLLATTNTLSQDIAVLPFMWIVPLGLYLLSFILCFNNPRAYSRPGYGLALLAGLAWIAWLMFPTHGLSLIWRSVTYLAVFFVCCMVCHGEVARLKPGPSHLTAFYLMLAIGGALGGIFVAVVAPLVFDNYYELPLGLVIALGLALIAYFSDADCRLYRGRPYWASSMVVLLALGLAIILVGAPLLQKPAQLSSSRNFYGTLTVREQHNYFPMRHAYTLRHGSTIHGIQFVNETLSRLPTGYYGERSGVGIALGALARQSNRRIGLIGLGIGTLSAYAQDSDYLRYYEIDPAVKTIAESEFTYLAESPARTDIVLGDARLSLEQEPTQSFDLLVLDAFTGDAIPVHLLTREAFTTYLRHMRADGVLAVHITNRHLDLRPVLFAVAAELGLDSAEIRHTARPGERGQYNSVWVLLTRDAEFLMHPDITASRGEREKNQASFRVWTDEYASIFRVLK
jgi:spermidine synthase